MQRFLRSTAAYPLQIRIAVSAKADVMIDFQNAVEGADDDQ
jgi:hypothetical protein